MKRRTCFLCRKKRYADKMQTVIHKIQYKPFPNSRVTTNHFAICTACISQVQQTTFINEIVLPEATKK